MPTISMFYGVVITMYGKREHNPPHFHARYQEFNAVFDFDGNLVAGKLPGKQQRLIVAWTVLHKDELLANWELLKAEIEPFRIDPLK